jgi:hypothetical protein
MGLQRWASLSINDSITSSNKLNVIITLISKINNDIAKKDVKIIG